MWFFLSYINFDFAESCHWIETNKINDTVNAFEIEDKKS